jgi:thiol:disulfide interchange protein
MARMRWMAVLGLLAAAASAADVSWERDFDKAKERAVKEDKLIFIDFYADW